MTFKGVNNITGPDSLVPTLFVFGNYARIVTNLPPSPLQQ